MGGTGQLLLLITAWQELGQDAGQIAGETAAGDVADAADGEVPEEVQHGVDVNAGGPEELLPQGLAQAWDLIVTA